ncbi:hypothetical protein MRY38_01915 [Escherichia coli]|nr:hypothetical protein [Escherichia coli]
MLILTLLRHWHVRT